MAVIEQASLATRKVRKAGGAAAKPAKPPRSRAQQIRNEIGVLAAFCAVLLFVYFMRHYSFG